MEPIYGTSVHPGIAIAVAARVETVGGVASLSPDRLRRIAERARLLHGDPFEPEQVILVANALPPGFAAGLVNGIEVAGIATGDDAAILPTPACPVVVGLGDLLMQEVEEDTLVIVDGNRGMIHVQPDAATVARYQDPTRARRRVFVDEAHMVARTASDNCPVTVLARVATLAALEYGIDAGADGFYMPPDGALLRVSDEMPSASDQLARLRQIGSLTGGMPLFLDCAPEQLAISALLEAAALFPLHIAVDGEDDVRELRSQTSLYLASAEDSVCGTLSYVLRVTTPLGDDFGDDLEPFSGIMYADELAAADPVELFRLSGLAQRLGRSMTLVLPTDSWPEVLEAAILFGFTTVVAPTDQIGRVKDVIRCA